MESKIKNGFLEIPYPKLLANADKTLVVLFSQARVGMVVYSTVNDLDVGHFSEAWVMPTFYHFNGLVELKN